MITQIKKGQIYNAYYKDGFYYDSPNVKYTEAEVICCTDKTIKLKNLGGDLFSKNANLCFCGCGEGQTITLKRNNKSRHYFSGVRDSWVSVCDDKAIWFSVYKNRAGKPTIFVLKT